MEVHQVACCPKKKAFKHLSKKKWQDTYEDTGFCSSVKQTWDGTLDGIVEPCLKPKTTMNSEVVNGYVVLSQFLSKSGTQWSTDGLYFDSAEPDGQQRFTGQIHVDYMFKCMHLSMTDLQSKCTCHCDKLSQNMRACQSHGKSCQSFPFWDGMLVGWWVFFVWRIPATWTKSSNWRIT
jgi:hypothetical protein